MPQYERKTVIMAAVIFVELLWPKPQRKIQDPWWAPEEDE